MAVGARTIIADGVMGKRDMTTIRGVDTTEKIFYISPYWIRELLIRNTGTNDVQIRLSDKEEAITVKPGSELNISGEFAYFLASASATQNIEILYRPSRKLIAKKVPPISLYFDGVDDNVTITNNESLKFENVLTVDTCVKFKEKAKYGAYVGITKKFGTSNGQYVIALDGWSNTIKAWVWYGSAWSNKVILAGSTPLLEYDVSIQLVAKAGDYAKLYQDNELKSSASLSALYTTTHNITVGGTVGGYFGASAYFNGLFYYLRLYKASLSDRELKHNYNNPYEPIKKGLVLYLSPYSVDIVNAKWYDFSGYENHGTIYGAQLKELWRPEQ